MHFKIRSTNGVGVLHPASALYRALQASSLHFCAWGAGQVKTCSKDSSAVLKIGQSAERP
jgi:hypothetical protein